MLSESQLFRSNTLLNYSLPEHISAVQCHCAGNQCYANAYPSKSLPLLSHSMPRHIVSIPDRSYLCRSYTCPCQCSATPLVCYSMPLLRYARLDLSVQRLSDTILVIATTKRYLSTLLLSLSSQCLRLSYRCPCAANPYFTISIPNKAITNLYGTLQSNAFTLPYSSTP